MTSRAQHVIAFAFASITAGGACGGEEMFEPQLASTERLIGQEATARLSKDDETLEQLMIVGDLDGDGIDDAVLRTFYGTEQAYFRATVYVLYGGSNITGDIDYASLPQITHTGAVNEVIAPVGDLDGDGFADLVVGRPAAWGCGDPSSRQPPDEDYTYAGAYVVYGSATRLTGATPIGDLGVFLSDTRTCTVVNVVEPLGDLDGDGHADFALGRTPSGNDPHEIYVFYGGAERQTAGEFPTLASAVIKAPATPPSVTPQIKRVGDVDGDGRDDFALELSTAAQSGQVSLVRGSATRLAGTVAPADIAQSQTELHRECRGFAAALGDLDGDGFDDFALPSCDFIPGTNKRAMLHRVFYGSAAGFPEISLGHEAATILASGFGHTEITAGDLDGDGRRDLLVGDDGLHDRNGGVHVMKGNGVRLSGTIDPVGRATTYIGLTQRLPDCSVAWTSDCTSPEYLGVGLNVGDITGDDHADFLVWAPAALSVSQLGFHGSAPGHIYLVSPPAAAKP